MIDQAGGSNGNGHGNGHATSGINRFAQTAPTMIFSLLQQLQALGLNVPEILGQLGVSQDGGKDTNGAAEAPEIKIVEEKKLVKEDGDKLIEL
jgi:hypothetical protein